MCVSLSVPPSLLSLPLSPSLSASLSSETMWDQVRPSESKWVQVIPSQSKWIQVSPNDSKWDQVSPSESKWVQVVPSDSKWVSRESQVSPSESEWAQVSPNESTWFQVCPSESKYFQVSPIESKLIKVVSTPPLPSTSLSATGWSYRYDIYRRLRGARTACPTPLNGKLISISTSTSTRPCRAWRARRSCVCVWDVPP